MAKLANRDRSTKETKQPSKRQSSKFAAKSSAEKETKYIQDPKKLRHIANHLDGFIAFAQEQNQSFASWTDVKDTFEGYSEQTGKARVGMDLCEDETGEVRGFRFFLKKEPSQTVTGAKLIKFLDLDSEKHPFVPSQLQEALDIEFAEANFEELDLDVDGEDLTNNDLNNELESDETELLQAFNEDDELTPDFSNNSNQISQRPRTRATSPRSASKADAQRWKDSRDIHSVDNLGNSMAKHGSELNGISLAGVALQAGIAGAAALAGDDLDRRLNRLQKQITETGKRVNTLGEEVEGLIGFPALDEIEETVTPQPEQPEQEHLQERTQVTVNAPISETDPTNPLASASNVLGKQINQIESTLNTQNQTEQTLEPLSSLELDPRSDVEQNLVQIEDYLNKLNERLDRLEAKLEELKEQLIQQGQSSQIEAGETTTEPIIPTEAKSEVSLNPSTETSPQETDSQNGSNTRHYSLNQRPSLSQKDQHLVTQTVEAVEVKESPVADALLRYAWVTQEISQNRATDGIPLSGTKALYLNQNTGNAHVLIVDNNGAAAFDAFRINDKQWTVKTEAGLSEADKAGILKLPQTRETYESEATAQDFVELLKTEMPDLFDPNTPENQRNAEVGGQDDQSDFRFEVTPVKGNLYLIEGFNAKTEEPVFDAITERALGRIASIRQNDISTHYLQAVIDPLLTEQKQPVSSEEPNEYREQQTEATPTRTTKQVEL